MRLWSLHPCYLDPQGLVALWREALLAREVLRGKTRGYRRHPQLERFRSHRTPLSAINAYLAVIHSDADERGYTFDARKLVPVHRRIRLTITAGQLEFEREHLRRKLQSRSPEFYRRFAQNAGGIRANPLFRIIPGDVQEWERSAVQPAARPATRRLYAR